MKDAPAVFIFPGADTKAWSKADLLGAIASKSTTTQ